MIGRRRRYLSSASPGLCQVSIFQVKPPKIPFLSPSFPGLPLLFQSHGVLYPLTTQPDNSARSSLFVCVCFETNCLCSYPSSTLGSPFSGLISLTSYYDNDSIPSILWTSGRLFTPPLRPQCREWHGYEHGRGHVAGAGCHATLPAFHHRRHLVVRRMGSAEDGINGWGVHRPVFAGTVRAVVGCMQSDDGGALGE